MARPTAAPDEVVGFKVSLRGKKYRPGFSLSAINSQWIDGLVAIWGYLGGERQHTTGMVRLPRVRCIGNESSVGCPLLWIATWEEMSQYSEDED